jgi:Rieske Fe-S protein
LLRLACWAALAAADAVVLVGCDTAPEPPAERRVPLASLPEGERVRVEVGKHPVELRRNGTEVAATLLMCTQWGRAVRWDEAGGVYRCPLHEGTFDADGRARTGPPTRAMRRLPVRVEGPDVVVTYTRG